MSQKAPLHPIKRFLSIKENSDCALSSLETADDVLRKAKEMLLSRALLGKAGLEFIEITFFIKDEHEMIINIAFEDFAQAR